MDDERPGEVRNLSRRRYLWTAAAGLLISSLMLSWFGYVRGKDPLRSFKKRGVLRVGYAVEAPYAFNRPDGTVTGEGPEIVRAIAGQLELPKIEWMQTSFDQLIPGLESGRFDIAAAGLFITPERAKRVLFSRPTFRVASGLLVPKGNPEGIRGVEDLQSKRDIHVAVLEGAFEAEYLPSAGVPLQQFVVVPDATTGRAAVQNGTVAGLALSAATVRWMVHENPDLFDAVVPFDSPSNPQPLQYGALAFPENLSSLRDAYDQALNEFIGTPAHMALIEQFGFSVDDLPASRSAEEVLR